VSIVEKLFEERNLSDFELKNLLETDIYDKVLFEKADFVRKEHYGIKVFTRGLIEFSNFCKNNCYYCGIRAKNSLAERYRLSKDEILQCCKTGYELGFRTFVLQSGEDRFFSDEIFCEIIESIRKIYTDCAITLSVGEKSESSYKKYREAGADRFLLRHETANDEHYAKLHPKSMSLKKRKTCLFTLKKLGFQTGSGFMVGSPFQTTQNLIDDLRFLQELKPEMVGIGPFIPHKDTPFADQNSGTLELTLRLIAVLRLLFPKALLPATTALGTIAPNGRELGLCAGANVVMPNLSPVKVRKKYSLYDNKICTGDEAAECRFCLENRIKSAGYEMVVDRGDALS